MFGSFLLSRFLKSAIFKRQDISPCYDCCTSLSVYLLTEEKHLKIKSSLPIPMLNE
jgi:hypothetical protein